MRQQDGSMFVLALALAGAVAMQACGGGDRAQRTAEGVDPATPPGASTDAVAQRQSVTLTGCVQRGVQPGEFILTSVATAGVLGTTEGEQEGRSWTADDASTDRSSARLAAGSSYRLITMGTDENLTEYENQRVAVKGQLAAETPVGTTGDDQIPPEGVVTESKPTGATVVGGAPPLRGLHVESVRRVEETCTPGQ